MKQLETSLIEGIKKILKPQTKTVILGHHTPDGDAMGASMGLYNFLKDKITDLNVMMPNRHTKNMEWLPEVGKIIIFEDDIEKFKQIFDAAELIICVDFNIPERVGDKMKHLLENSKSKKILLDHHPQPGNFADFTISDISVSSASEIIYEFIKLIFPEAEINIDSASCIFSGIMTDTNCFSVNSSKKGTYEIVSELLAIGVQKDTIYDKVYNNYSLSRMRLLGYVLDNKLKLIQNNSIAYFSLSIQEQKKYDFTNGDSDGFVNYPLSISGVNVSVFFTEKPDFIKLSLRSSGDYDVNLFSRKFFNGGGHKNAAGGRLFNISLFEAEKFFIKKANEFFNTP